MDPIVARGFVELGFDTKEKLIAWCADNALMTAREYWDNQWIQYLMRPRAVAGVEPYASRLKAGPDEVIRIFEPRDIHIVVAGENLDAKLKLPPGEKWMVPLAQLIKDSRPATARCPVPTDDKNGLDYEQADLRVHWRKEIWKHLDPAVLWD